MAMSTEVHKCIKRCRKHSDEKCCALRKEIKAIFPANSNDVVLVCGSYARREAAGSSDVDYFLVTEEEDEREDSIEAIKKAVDRLGLKAPSQGGSFAKKVTRQSIIQNIGGAEDSNDNITQRMLLLLEGDWLFNEEGFRGFRRKILRKYLGAGHTRPSSRLVPAKRHHPILADNLRGLRVQDNSGREAVGNPERQAGVLSQAPLRERSI